MISGYALLGAFFLGGLLFVSLGLLVSRMLQQQNPNPEKNTPYECGEESQGQGQTFFNFRFQLPALIFVLFEVEIVLLTPVLVAQNQIAEGISPEDWIFQIKLVSLFFVLLLSLGFAAAWALGYLEWDKPEYKPVIFEGPIPDWAYEQANLTFEKDQLANLSPDGTTLATMTE